jgi:hypothetical protein
MKSKTLSVSALGWIAAVVARRFNVSRSVAASVRKARLPAAQETQLGDGFLPTAATRES